MSDFQKEKQVVRSFLAKLDSGDPAGAHAAFCADDWHWYGYAPFDSLVTPAQVATQFWQPLQSALTSMQRRMDIFMAGENWLDDGSVWVVTMGHLMGLFDEPWLGIQPTRRIAMLRYASFYKVEGDKITANAMYFDIPHLMMQAGQNPFPPQTGAHLVQPGPMTHDALMFDMQDPAEGKKTRAAIDFMCTDISKWSGGRDEPLVEELRRSWNEDMIWWGPHGIGATYTIPRYAEQHSGPFREAFGTRDFKGHVCRISEGNFGGFFGWPNLVLEHNGGFMGMPGTGQKAEMRVIDLYRRDGDKLTENWIFIDLIHFWKQQGLDVLGRMESL